MGRGDLPGKEGSRLVPGGLPYGKEQAMFCVASEGSRQMGDIVRTQIPIQNRGEFLTSSAAWHDAERLSSWLSQLGG